MKKVYVGIDAHKDENVFGSAVEGRAKEELIGKCSADMNRTLTFIRSFMKKNNLTKGKAAVIKDTVGKPSD